MNRGSLSAALIIACAVGARFAVSDAAVPIHSPFSDLPKSFAGTLPCADCPGIDWQLDLLPDGSFQLRRVYLDLAPNNVIDRIGRWVIGSDGRSLALGSEDELSIAFEILDEDHLVLLDQAGQPIESDLDYMLAAADLPLTEPEVVMKGLYSYMADAARFRECSTGRSLPIAFSADNMALERAYLDVLAADDLEPGSEVLVELFGRIAPLPPMEGDRHIPQIEPIRFIGLQQGAACPEPFQPADLQRTFWSLAKLGGKRIDVENEQRRPSITFLDDDAGFTGYGGCNHLTGGYASQADQLRFAAIAGTLMACAEGMELEAAFKEALEAADRFRILGHHLDLYDLQDRHLARFVASEGQ